MAEEKETADLEGQLEAYKSKAPQAARATLTWDRELVFVGRTSRGYEIEMDAAQQWGCAPTESLLLSLAGCMGIDMLSFLQKMRCGIKTYRMDIAGDRNPTPPQYYTSIEMVIAVTGSGLTPRKIERAIALSQEKYCSVYHSLRKDLRVKVDYTYQNVG